MPPIPPFKKRVPLLHFDTAMRKTSATIIAPVIVYLGAAPHMPCPTVPTKFKAYACSPAPKHEPHIDGQDAPFWSSTSGYTVVTSTSTALPSKGFDTLIWPRSSS